MPHAPARWCSKTSNEGNHRLRICSSVVLGKIRSCFFFGSSSNFSDEEDSFGLRIIKKDFQTINKVSPVEWIASNSNTESLAKSNIGGLVNCFICKRARSGDNANIAWHVNVSWHDSDFAFARKNNT
uniref:Uncharacterized protein n=1 Tax=Ciona intestinalis TaxID=7719 RepID=H2XZV9_CIOIN